MKEGSLEAPDRQPIAWREPEFWDPAALEQELERVYDICHGCRRCVNLCEAFPTLFDLVDESDTLEVDGVAKEDFGKVVDECYLCDLCAETKCPYLPPHEWAVDFPHLMLRAKAQKFRQGQTRWRDRLITSSDNLLSSVSRPMVAGLVNKLNKQPLFRRALEKVTGIHQQAPLPEIQPPSVRRKQLKVDAVEKSASTPETTGKVAIFTTCYGHHISPSTVADIAAVLTHNSITTILLPQKHCCGMPKLELGDLDAVARLKEATMPQLVEALDAGYDLVAPIPSCALMFRQEIPLLYPNDEQVARVKARFFDPAEYLMLRHKAGLLNLDFQRGLGRLAYHIACHQRVQRIGRKTQELFGLIPDTELTLIERCSGHDGTYAWKKETYAHAMKIARPVARRVDKANPDACMSDCLMAGRMIAHSRGTDDPVPYPLSLLRQAYGI